MQNGTGNNYNNLTFNNSFGGDHNNKKTFASMNQVLWMK